MESSRNGKNRFTKTYRRHRKLHDECYWATESFYSVHADHYQLHLFSEFDSFKKALHQVNFFSLIYSLSDAREERRNCLAHLRDLAFTHSHIQRIILVSDVTEARLISHLSPSRLHGVVSKSMTLEQLQNEFVVLLNETLRINDNMLNHWYHSQNRMLSPTERAILRYMSCGYSIPEIAAELERNIKTIRRTSLMRW